MSRNLPPVWSGPSVAAIARHRRALDIAEQRLSAALSPDDRLAAFRMLEGSVLALAQIIGGERRLILLARAAALPS